MAQTLREQVKKMVGEDEDLNPEEFSNLILDELKITQLTTEDKAFLEEFKNLELLAMNNTGIKSLVNLPDAPNLVRIEMADNKLPGSELKHLLKYPQLKVIKFGANLLKDYADLEVLKPLSGLQSLDLNLNPISEKDSYDKKVFEMFPSLEILDGLNKEGDEVLSEDDDEYGGQEEGEADGEMGADDEYGEEDFDDAEYGEDDDYGSDDDGEEGEGLGKR
jgi:acidic leucine-rich nuclear phosphoprotein 32 family member A/C/D